MSAPHGGQTPDQDDPAYTAQGEAAEQAAFTGEGEYSGGGFAGGPEELTGADGEQPTAG